MNKNGNQRRSAIITFASKKKMEAAQTKPIRFNNYLLFWQEESREKKHSEEKVCYKGYVNTYNIDKNSDTKEYKSKRSERRNDIEESKKNR